MEPQTLTSLSGALEVSKMIPFSRKTTRFYSDEAAFHFMGVVVDALFLHTDVICLSKGGRWSLMILSILHVKMMKAMPESVKKGTGFGFCFIQIIGISSSLDGSSVYIISEYCNFFFFSPFQGEKKVVESGVEG